jgi:hypothetical protein
VCKGYEQKTLYASRGADITTAVEKDGWANSAMSIEWQNLLEISTVVFWVSDYGPHFQVHTEKTKIPSLNPTTI